MNQLLLEPLRAMTQAHCAYCDGFPISTTGLETIDHFRPKSRFCELSYSWENLFYACERCNHEKGERFDPSLLKPDAADFDFDRYFQVNYRTGALEPSASSSEDDRTRASKTIELLALNRADRREARKGAVRQFAAAVASLDPRDRAAELDLYPYRFMLRDV